MNEAELPVPFDKQVLEMLHDAIGESMTNIVSLFLTEVPQQITQMQQALQTGDLETASRLAHSLKSSAANLGAMRLAAMAADLELRIKNTDKNIVASAIVKLRAEFDQIRNMYTEYL